MKKEKGSPEEIESLLNLAQDDFKNANLNLKEEFYRQAIVSSYYTVLSSSRALLLNEGFLPKSHSGVLIMLGLHIISKGILPKVYSTKIKKLFKERLDANYNAQRDFSKNEAEEAIEFAEEFYTKVKQIMSSDL